MSAREMTIREIAELCGVDTKTVRRWVDKVSRGAGQNAQPELKARSMAAGEAGESVKYTLDETLAIVRAGGKTTLAALLAENAAKRPAAAPKLPNGVQLHELGRLVEKHVISNYQAQLLLGVAIPRENPLPEVPMSAEEASAAFARIRAAVEGRALPPPAIAKATRAAAGAYACVARREADKAAADSKQGRLM